MDLGTVGGFALVTVLLLAAILMGSSLMTFVDVPSLLIVVLGSFSVLFISFPKAAIFSALSGAKKVLSEEPVDYESQVKLLEELSNRARREGLLSLEESAESAEDPFLQRGLRMMADGQEASTVESVLYDEIDQIAARHGQVLSVWDGLGEIGPAMGMIGTLIGLVQMLQQMDDPAAIGPAMAVALLTTFYGSLLANIVAIPISKKLKIRSKEELMMKELLARGMMSIMNGENPRFLVERLNSTLPPNERLDLAA